MTQAEKTKLIAELNRQVADGWNTDKLARLKTIRAAHPGWDYDLVWSEAERQQRDSATEPKSISQATRLIQAEHLGWTFQQSWDFAEGIFPQLVKGSKAAREGRPEVPALPVRAVEPTPKPRMLLIRGHEGTYID